MKSLFKEKPDKPFVLKENYEEDLKELLKETSYEEKVLNEIFDLEKIVNDLNDKLVKDPNNQETKLNLSKVKEKLADKKKYYNKLFK